MDKEPRFNVNLFVIHFHKIKRAAMRNSLLDERTA